MSSDINEAYKLFEENPILFGKHYFPNHLRFRTPYFHWLILNESYNNRFFACVAPRGSAKSTILSFLKPMHRIVFKKKRFIVIVQNTYKKAVGTLEGIKDEFKYNEKLRGDFRVEFEKDAEGDTIFRHPDGFRTKVLCKGHEQMGSVRGEKFGAYRPDYILGDDIEDDEMVKSSERRNDLKKVFDEALMEAGDFTELEVDIIGTILHDDALMVDLISKNKYKDYKKLFFQARYENKSTGIKESLWPERWTLEQLNILETDKPEVFAKEYQGDPASGSLETIRREDFRYWRMEEGQAILFGSDGEIVSRWKLCDCRAGVGIDLAWGTKEANDFSAIVPGLITPANDLLIDSYIVKKGMRPDELENILFDMNERFERLTGHRVQFGFEKANLEKVMKWFLTEAMRRRNKWLWFKDINWGTQDKVSRIMFRLANRYTQHAIYHKKGMGDLENQLIRLRSSAHDDLCLSGEVKVLTMRGNIKIKNVKVGDYVRTRNGFRKVLISKCTGRKKVTCDIGIIGTPNHPIITKLGIKRLDSIHVDDILYIWNEKLSSIEEKSTTDILTQCADSIECISGDMISGKKHQWLYTGRFTSIIMETYQKVMLSIIKMKIRLIMNQKTSNVYQSRNICDSIQANQRELIRYELICKNQFIQKNQNKKQENGTKVPQEKIGIRNTPSIWISENPIPVYNLTVDVDNEYFANGVLVHNCDAVGMLPEMLAFAPSAQKPKTPEDMFMTVRKNTPLYRERNKSKYIFGRGQKPLPFRVVNAI